MSEHQVHLGGERLTQEEFRRIWFDNEESIAMIHGICDRMAMQREATMSNLLRPIFFGYVAYLLAIIILPFLFGQWVTPILYLWGLGFFAGAIYWHLKSAHRLYVESFRELLVSYYLNEKIAEQENEQNERRSTQENRSHQ